MPDHSPIPAQYAIGVDLGGTNIVVGAMTLDGSQTFGLGEGPTMAWEGAEAVIERMAGMVNDVIAATMAETGAARKDFIGVGVGAPGTVDRMSGVVRKAPNLGWLECDLVGPLSRLTGLPVHLDNDANCATYGEWWMGAARGGVNVIGVTIGTGVGGGIIVDRQVYYGASDAAGEIGHTTIDMDGRRCGCGNYGCLEAYTSGPAIASRAREALVNHEESSLLLTLAQGDAGRVTAELVYDAADAGDEVALEIVRDTARFLGAGIANLLNVFNPDVVVLAGGVTKAGDALFEPLRKEVRRRAFKNVAESCRIVPGELPGTAGVVGAVAAFITKHTGRPPA